MARTNTAVSVASTATQLAAKNQARTKIAFANNGAATVYLGDANVTTANGFPVAAGASLIVDIGAESADGNMGDVWYGIVAGANVDVRVLEW